MRKNTITILGGSGFLGRYLTQAIAEEGAIIRIGVRHIQEAAFLKPMGSVAQITPIATDFRKPDSLKEVIFGSDIVINCVGILTESTSCSFDQIHHLTPEKIAELCRDMGIKKLIHFSALGADKHSKSAYARSKALGEEAVLKHYPEAVIIRPSVVFGTEDQFFNKFADMAQILPFLPLIGGGATKFQPVYVHDIARFVVLLLKAKSSPSSFYELVGPSVLSLKEIYMLICKLIERKKYFINLPFGFAKFLAHILQYFPGSPLTPDQVELLKSDNVAKGKYPGLDAFNINPTSPDIILPVYLSRYRPGGRYISLQRKK